MAQDRKSRLQEFADWTAARHNITPQTEHFPMSQTGEAFAHLQAGKANYRIVLDADF